MNLTDLCDHWIDLTSHRCQNYWKEEIVLDEVVNVAGGAMFGTYQPGVWRFCRMHARIFHRDKT